MYALHHLYPQRLQHLAHTHTCNVRHSNTHSSFRCTALASTAGITPWWIRCNIYVYFLFLPSLFYHSSIYKRSRSFCQKCRWQVTAKHTCTLCMWLCMKWHGAWLYGVHNMHQDGSSFMWHQPCQRCKYPTSVDTEKRRYKELVNHVPLHANAVNLLERAENNAI